MTLHTASIVRAARYGEHDRFLRAPELAFLAQRTVAIVGLGCIGAPSALEFARAGVSELWLMDPDIVDASSTIRWPLGIAAAGAPKTEMLAQFIAANYPHTVVKQIPYSVGGSKPREVNRDSAGEILEPMLRRASLLYDATAERSVQRYLSDVAASYGIPYMAVSATPGGWGGEIIRIVPNLNTGCWFCLQCNYDDEKLNLPKPPEDLTGMRQAEGCAGSTFTAAGFDILQVVAAGVRAAVSLLGAGEPGRYPAMPWDGMVIRFRDTHGALIPPAHEVFPIARHPNCRRCNP
jgi:molybdopterin/thiamine biosynthesis adenylyltransferase